MTLTHPFSHCRYDIGHVVPMGLLGSTDGTITQRTISETSEGVRYLYLVEYRAWPGERLDQQWMSEETLDEYEALKLKHDREVAASRREMLRRGALPWDATDEERAAS